MALAVADDVLDIDGGPPSCAADPCEVEPRVPMPREDSALVVKPPTTRVVNTTAPSVPVRMARPSSPRSAAASSASANAMAPRKPLNHSIRAWFAGTGPPL
jgi:hypothetical protein